MRLYVLLLAFSVSAFIFAGCGGSGSSEGSDNSPQPPEVTTASGDAYSDDGEISASDQRRLSETQCQVAKATQGMSPEEADAWGEEIADEIIEAPGNPSISDILAERGITC